MAAGKSNSKKNVLPFLTICWLVTHALSSASDVVSEIFILSGVYVVIDLNHTEPNVVSGSECD